MKFTMEAIKSTRMLSLAQLIHDHWSEGSGMDTRYFEVPLIHDSFVEYGQLTNGGNYREHVVPRVFLRDACLRMYEEGATIDDVRQALMSHLWIVRITVEEAKYLNGGLRLKTHMPENWRFGLDDPFARLHAAGIRIVRNSQFSSSHF